MVVRGRNGVSPYNYCLLLSSSDLHHKYCIAISGSVVIIVQMHMAIATGAWTG